MDVNGEVKFFVIFYFFLKGRGARGSDKGLGWGRG